MDAESKNNFEALVKANMKRAYYTALGLMGCHDMAMELSQEAFLRAYKHFDKFDQSKNFFTWYYKILRNLCLNAIRDKKNKKESFLQSVSQESLSVDPVAEYDSSELKFLLEDALMKLSIDDREIITMREFEGINYKEIAELLSIPIGTVMSRLYYARKRLSDIMKQLNKN